MNNVVHYDFEKPHLQNQKVYVRNPPPTAAAIAILAFLIVAVPLGALALIYGFSNR